MAPGDLNPDFLVASEVAAAKGSAVGSASGFYRKDLRTPAASTAVIGLPLGLGR